VRFSRVVGLYAISYAGIEVVDRSLVKGKFSIDDVLALFEAVALQTAAYAGRGGGRKLANDSIANLEEEGEVSLSKLRKLILSEGLITPAFRILPAMAGCAPETVDEMLSYMTT
jgi:hypothetical protein